MDLYNLILKNGGQVLQDGSAFRDIVSKDGLKLVRQFAQKNGASAYDVFDRATGKALSSYRKTPKADGSFLTKIYDASGLKQLFAVQKLGEQDSGSFMSVLFKNKSSKGDFIHCINKQLQKRGEVTYMPVNKSVIAPNAALASRTNIFNSKFGKFDLK